MDIYGVTEKEENAFEMKLRSSSNSSEYYDTRLELDIRVNKDRTKIQRAVYNIFALLGDIGGFYGLFVSFAATLLGIINY